MSGDNCALDDSCVGPRPLTPSPLTLQAALEDSAEDAIVAAEGRASHAATLAKEAEERAARSAAAATAYQDRAQVQAAVAAEAARASEAGRGGGGSVGGRAVRTLQGALKSWVGGGGGGASHQGSGDLLELQPATSRGGRGEPAPRPSAPSRGMAEAAAVAPKEQVPSFQAAVVEVGGFAQDMWHKMLDAIKAAGFRF